MGDELTLEHERLIEQFKAELRQALKDIEGGKGIPLAEFDWGLPPHIAESKGGEILPWIEKIN